MTPHQIVHLGMGAFHRAHQAAYLQALHDSGDGSWRLFSGDIRPGQAAIEAALLAQGSCYTLETVAPDATRRYQRIDAMAVVPHAPDLAALIALGAAPATRIVSFTVTEAGYYLDSENRLDAAHPDIAADLSAARAGEAGATIYGALTAILRQRMRQHSGKLTLLCCDNLRHNGARSRAGLLQFIALTGDLALYDWVQHHTSSPNAMVDRITPRPQAGAPARVLAATGWHDRAPVMCEQFAQWIVEDAFCNGRPAWEQVGVQMVDAVAPYEEAKIRILNASHSCFAWAGLLRGYAFIHEGARDAAIVRIARQYIVEDVTPCLQPSPLDLAHYGDTVLARFANAALGDSNARVASDSFAKIPGFIAPTIAQRLAQGASIDGGAALVALFLGFLKRWNAGLLDFAYQDQAMEPAHTRAICDAIDPVAALCADSALWGGFAGDSRFVAAVRMALPIAAALSTRDTMPA